MLPQDYEFQGPTYKRGRLEGQAAAMSADVLDVLDVRGISVSEEVRQRVQSTTDLEQLRRWHRRAVVVTRANELFDEQRRTVVGTLTYCAHVWGGAATVPEPSPPPLAPTTSQTPAAPSARRGAARRGAPRRGRAATRRARADPRGRTGPTGLATSALTGTRRLPKLTLSPRPWRAACLMAWPGVPGAW